MKAKPAFSQIISYQIIKLSAKSSYWKKEQKQSCLQVCKTGYCTGNASTILFLTLLQEVKKDCLLVLNI